MPSEDEINSVEAPSRLARDDGKDCTVGEEGGSCLPVQDTLKLICE